MVVRSAAPRAGEFRLENKAVTSSLRSLFLDAAKKKKPEIFETQKYKKSKVPNIGSSLVDFFNSAEIQEHLLNLKRNCGQFLQSNVRTRNNSVLGQCSKPETDQPCQLCGCAEVSFAPQAFCAGCGCRMKESWPFWTLMVDGTNLYVCRSCFNACKGDIIELEGETYHLSSLNEGESLADSEEPWVRCDKCSKWQHEVCALFNAHLNNKGQADYTCPMCWIKIREENCIYSTSSAVNGAKDLPRTTLSDYIENHLEKRLEYEKCERALAQKKNLDEVPVANPLVVRVVSCADKKLEVKDNFLNTFQEDGYPREFLYKSKIGYLDFCKKRGFTRCNIWVSPPREGDDYIFNCHPQGQKTPRSNKLQNWCYDVQINLDISQRHPANKTKKHQLSPITTSILGDTLEADDKVPENEFFDTRETFLSICQSNHYQFDTLRKAKHSSMMVLYHLHNPTASTLPVTREDTLQESGQDVMDSEAEKVQEKRKISKDFLVIDLLKHTFQCTSSECEYGDDCQQVKKLFRHERGCDKKIQGNCVKCKKIWSVLQVHARVCKDEECNVFHCSEYKTKLRRRAELRHQAALSERVRSQEEENEPNKDETSQHAAV